MTKNLLSSSFHPKRFSVSLALLIFAVILHIFTSAVAAKCKYLIFFVIILKDHI